MNTVLAESNNISITVRGNSLEEEFEYLKRTVRRMPFYLEHGYTVGLPKVDELRTVAIFKDVSQAFKLFKEKEYTADFFTAGVQQIEKLLPVVKSCFPKLLKLNKLWGFRLFSDYSVLLTKYGPGGSYDPKCGTVTMLVNKGGTFKRDKPEQTIIHEIVHMGVEDCIVKTYKLSHQEKERLVDLVVKTLFSDISPGYRVQSFGESRIDEYISSNSITTLPSVIEDYVRSFPR